MQETVLGQTLEAIGQVKDGLDSHSKGLHGKLDGQGRSHENLAMLMRGVPDHDALLKSVHSLMAEHVNDHSSRITREISKLPLPPDEKVMLQAIENMEEAVL